MQMSLFDPPAIVRPEPEIGPRQPLRYYQEEGQSAVHGCFSRGVKRVLVIMATGTGKTVLFSEVIKDFAEYGKRSLVLAHRGELLGQARNKIKQQSGINAGLEKAKFFGSLMDMVIAASVQSMQRKRLSAYDPDHFDLTVIDEAHHTPAMTYQNILQHFGSSFKLGVTATPDRADDKQLGNHYDEIAYQYSMVQGIKDGFLVPIRGRRVKDFDIDLSEMRTRMGDFLESELEGIIREYVAPISKAIVRETSHLKTMIFLPSVKSSEMISTALCDMGLNAAYLSGEHSEEQRDYVLEQFEKGEVTHLCNCNLFLEGYDEPSIQCVVMGRPTKSRPLYAQAVGRGTRPHESKDHLLLVEFTYNYQEHQLVTAYELFASQGYEEVVRQQAETESKKVPGDVDFLKTLESAHQYHYSFQRILDNLTIKAYNSVEYNPFELCNLAGVDLTGELDIKYNGRSLNTRKGSLSMKQLDILNRYNIHDADLMSTAQASAIIGLIKNNKWNVNNIIKNAERSHAQGIMQ